MVNIQKPNSPVTHYSHIITRSNEPDTMALVTVFSSDPQHSQPSFTLQVLRDAITRWREAKPEDAEEFIEYDTDGDCNIGDIISYNIVTVLADYFPPGDVIYMESVNEAHEWVWDTKLV